MTVKIQVGNTWRPATPEELAKIARRQLEAEARRAAEERKPKPPTLEQRIAAIETKLGMT